MHAMLLAAAAALAVAVPAAPAEAERAAGSGFSSGGRIQFVDHRSPGHGDRHDGRRHRRHQTNIIIGDWGDDDWGYYNNRTFDPDSFNDWWHERPHRSYPRWLTSSGCERQWWAGSTLRC